MAAPLTGRGRAKLSDEEFIALFPSIGATGIAEQFGVQEHNVYKRRARIEKRLGFPLVAPNKQIIVKQYPHRQNWNIKNGEVIIGSDFHLWPGQESLMLRAFKKIIAEIQPAGVILNGDVLDFPRISRHPPIGWEKTPLPQEEIEAAQDHLSDIQSISRRAKRSWNLGNHDARFETRLATVAPEFAKVAGIHLSDHFPLWTGAWSTWINDDVVVKHRFKGGIHATHNNTMSAGKSMITGHLHSAKVTPFTDYNGTRFGVDTGCVAETDAKQFTDYTEDGPLNWRSGFCILTFRDGVLLWPELVTKFDDEHYQFRGKVFRA